MKKVLFGILALAVAAGLYLFPGMVESSIPSIYYVTPNHKTHRQVLHCTGTLQPARMWEVYLQSPAFPRQVGVKVGEEVEEGQLLVSLTPASQLSEDVLAVLSGYQSGGGSAFGADIASVAALYGLSSTLSGGLADYTDLAGLLQLMQEERVSEVSGQLVGDSQTAVYAPASGIVTAVTVQEHVPAFPGFSLVTISDTSRFKVRASVPEGDVAKIRVGQQATVRCVGDSSKPYGGVVTKIYPTAHKMLKGTATETVVDVEITLDGEVEGLKSGFSAKVEISAGDGYSLITVPYESIRQDENNDEYVYVYEDGKIKKNPVTTGQELVSEVEITQGLAADSIVIYNPGDIVREGTMIHLKGRANVA